MSLRPEQLPGRLQQSLDPVYLIGGKEPLIVQECRDAVIRAAQAQGYTERNVFEVGGRFDWSALEEDAQALSLFSSRKILDIRLPTGKPGNEGSDALVRRVQAGDPDVLLLVSTGDWSQAIARTKWAKTLAAAGALVEVWPIKPQQLPGWIGQRMKQAGLQPERDAVASLTRLVEGNLLAAQQEIDKLALLRPGARVTADDVLRSAANSARFDVFRLVECAFDGRLEESLRVAGGLQRTGVAIQVVTAVLYNELSVAEAVRCASRAGESESAAFARLRVWATRQGPIRRLLGRLDGRGLGECFRALGLIDRQSKGRAGGEPWQTLDRLLWYFCDPRAAARLL